MNDVEIGVSGELKEREWPQEGPRSRDSAGRTEEEEMLGQEKMTEN